MIVGYTVRYQLWGDTVDRRLEPDPTTPKGLHPSTLHAWRALFREVAPRATSDLDAVEMGLDKIQKVEILSVVEDRTERPQMTKRH